MKFKIENERLRIRRHGVDEYSYEIPELDIKSGGWTTAKGALDNALSNIGRLTPAGELKALRDERDVIESRLGEIFVRIAEVEKLPVPPVADLLEQKELCRRAIGMLNYDEDQAWGVKVKMVGFYDVGDKDGDGDRDFVVSYTW